MALVIVVVIEVGNRSPSSAPTAGATNASRPRDSNAELLSLVRAGEAVTYEAQYSVSNSATGSQQAHLWRRPPLARMDTEGPTGETTETLVGASGPVRCSRQPTGPWTCTSARDLNLGSLNVVSPALVAQVAQLTVTETDDQVAGQRVRCFRLSKEGAQPSVVCFTTDGIPARAEVGTSRVELVSVERSPITDAVFQPPAAVGG